MRNEINRLRRESADFSRIPEDLKWVDERMANWGRWCRGGTAPQVSPGFELYRSTEHSNSPSGAPRAIDVDGALAVQDVIRRLSVPHRKTLQWCYVRPTNPARRARELGVGSRGLYELMIEALRVASGMLAKPFHAQRETAT